MIEFREVESREEWDDFVDDSNGNGLQIWGWGEVKSKHGWSAERILFLRGGGVIGGAQVLRRKLPVFGAMLYVPRGPVVKNEKDRSAVLLVLAKWAEKYRGKVVCLMVEPDWELEKAQKTLKSAGWQRSQNYILLAETMVVDLSGDMDELFAKMSKKRRNYIKKYLRSGLRLEEVKTEEDFRAALRIYKEIAVRAKFNLHVDSYYLDIWREMGEHQLLAVVKNEKGKVIAFQWALLGGKNVFALFGGVGAEGRERQINVGVKWECMGLLRERGYTYYDFNGLLNEKINFYKHAFLGRDVELAGAWEIALSKKYAIYSRALPAGKKLVHFLEKVRN